MGSSTSPLRIGVIGQGYFAQAAILPALAQLEGVEIAALVSGSKNKLQELGERYPARSRAGDPDRSA